MAESRRGGSAAYERLLADIAGSLRPLVRCRLRRHSLGDAEAEDIVQEVLIAIHTKRHTWDESRPFLPWLNAIAHHKLVDAARRMMREAKSRREVAEDEWEDLFEAPSPDPERGAENLERHLRTLPARQRDVVDALVFEGLSVRDVADRLRTSEGVVRMTFHRALMAVRHALHSGSTEISAEKMRAREVVSLEEER